MMPESLKSKLTAYRTASVISRSEFHNAIGGAVLIYEKYREMRKIGE